MPKSPKEPKKTSKEVVLAVPMPRRLRSTIKRLAKENEVNMPVQARRLIESGLPKN
jgi:hypothetical protein